jgi:hypothetical protein
MLDERYIVKLLRLKRDRSNPFDKSSQYLHYLWSSYARKMLGWREGQLEGHPKGLSSKIYTILCDVIFSF